MKNILLAIVLTLILASCTSQDRPSGIFVGGSGGVVLSFEDGAPPSVVYDNAQTPMPVIFRVRNTGEFDTGPVRVTLSGINSNDFRGFASGPHEVERVRGKALLQDQVLEGETEFLDLGELYYDREVRGSSLDFSVSAKACYGYATMATATVCLSDAYYGQSISCDPDVASISSSAAPVAIRSIESSAVGTNRLRFSFEVSRTGQGRIWAPHDGQSCPSDQQSLIREGDRVYVRVDDGFPGRVVSCSGFVSGSWDASSILNTPQEYREPLSSINADAEGFVRLSDGRAKVQCTMTVPEGTDSRGTIDIVAAYYVEDSVSRSFSVQRSGVSSDGSNFNSPSTPTAPRDVTSGSEQFIDASRYYAQRVHSACSDFSRRMDDGGSVTALSTYRSRLGLYSNAYALCISAGTNNLNDCPGSGHVSGPEQQDARAALLATTQRSFSSPDTSGYYDVCLSTLR